MKTLNNIKTVIFDFGGTLDTDGIHWSEMFWDSYQKFNIPIDKNTYSKAYRNAEPKVEKYVNESTNFNDTLHTQVLFQFQYLVANNLLPKAQWENEIEQIVNYCYNYTLSKIEISKTLLTSLINKYSLGLVSNFYGNVAAVLEELGINNLFKTIVDSSVVGISKPDPKIFSIAVENLNSDFSKTVIIGDSYSRDIEPAKKLGCYTIWLDGKSWSRTTDTSCADFTINSIVQIKELLNI